MRNDRVVLLRRGIPLFLLLLAQACNLGPIQTDSGIAPSLTPFEPERLQTLSAGGGSESVATFTPEPPTATPTETPIPLVYPVGPSGFPSNVNPLTGLAVRDPQLLDRRPLAIKVTNFPRTARPQAGLSRADLLWEFYTEFGNTRWIAMYYGQEAEKVGPIRSARVLDTRIVPLYDAILVHVQAYETVWVEISKSGVDTINEFPASCPAICRDASEPVIENSAFGNTSELTKYARRIGLLAAGRPPLDGMMFDPTPPANGTGSSGARIYFSSSATAEWMYDPEAKRYLRLSETATGVLEPLTDRTSSEQLAVDNVLVLFVRIFGYTGKKGIGEQFDMDLSTSGNGYFFRDGVMVKGQWRSGGPNAPLQFVDSAMQNYALHPGTTYIAVVRQEYEGSSASTASTQWWFKYW